MRSSIGKKIYFLYFVLIAAACGSMLFTNIDYDAEYQIAMAYRMIKGDGLITEMWEPHQTSAFLCALLMKIYMVVTGTTTGIVLYTQIVGLLIRGAIAWLLVKTVKSISDEKIALLVGAFYLLISPKEILTPDFSNMQLWFATLMLLTLWQYFKNKKRIYLVLAAVCLCVSVLAYPSFIIGYIAAVVILWKNSETFKQDMLLFTGVCVLIGGTFAGYLLISIGWDTIMKCLEHALAVEPTHTVGIFQKAKNHAFSILKISGMLVCVGMIGFVAENILRLAESCREKCRVRISWNRWLVISWYVLMFFFLVNILSVENRGGYAYPLVVIMVLGFCKRGLLSAQERLFFQMALWIGSMNLLATLMLSDAVFLQGVAYALLIICASLLPLYRWLNTSLSTDRGKLKKSYVCGMGLFLLLLIFRCIYIHIPMSGRGQIMSLASDLALIRSGPAIGIIADEEGVAKVRDSMAEWKDYVQEGDTIWILAEPVNTLSYLYEDVEVGAPSVMSTPTYSEVLEYYWELNPDKYPTVVIVASGFGELAWEMQTNQWVMNWLEEYEADEVIDGNYWRYYIKR